MNKSIKICDVCQEEKEEYVIGRWFTNSFGFDDLCLRCHAKIEQLLKMGFTRDKSNNGGTK